MAPTRKVIANVDELDDGDMKQVSVGELDILLTKIDGEYFANGAHCTHYGAPLADGVLDDTGEIICPWHHAVFDLRTGEHLQAPGRDCLTHFPTEIDGGDIIVEVPEDAGESRLPTLIDRNPSNSRHFVVLGGGQAGSTAAETLRKEGFSGRITVVSRDPHLPYDRPNLSKAYLTGEAEAEWLPLRPVEFWAENDIEFLTNTQAVDLQTNAQQVELSNGTTLKYDQLLVATGAAPNPLPVPGADHPRVFPLRTRMDCESIIQAAESADRAVIIGSSFIGMEVAASLRHRGLEVEVISRESEPFEGIFGPQVGRYFRDMHETQEVKFRLESDVDAIAPTGSQDLAIEFADGPSVHAPLVVIGVGVHPATEFVANELPRQEDGGIKTDVTLRTSENVWAAGDVAAFPDLRTGRRIRIEHWQLAGQHGKLAALNMLGAEREYSEIPFFWTRQYQNSFKYVGHADRWDEVIIDGDVSDGDFVAYYTEADQVLAAAGTRGGDLTYLQALMRHQALPPAEALRSGDWPV